MDYQRKKHISICKYMIDIVAKQKHLSMVKMEKIPCFYFLYSNIFLKVVHKTDLWESTQKHGKDYFDVTMKKCLWHTACVRNDCAAFAFAQYSPQDSAGLLVRIGDRLTHIQEVIYSKPRFPMGG